MRNRTRKNCTHAYAKQAGEYNTNTTILETIHDLLVQLEYTHVQKEQKTLHALQIQPDDDQDIQMEDTSKIQDKIPNISFTNHQSTRTHLDVAVVTPYLNCRGKQQVMQKDGIEAQ